MSACGSDGDGKAGAGAGGAGTGGAGAGGAGASGVLALPGCVRDLAASCPTTGACTSTAARDSVCFAGGTRAVTTGSACNATDAPVVTAVTTPAGAACYTFERVLHRGMACENGTLTWKNASGQVVATGSFGGGSFGAQVSISCAAGGETSECKGPECSRALPFPTDACTEGTCTGG